MFHLFPYVCYSKRYMLQVFHEQAREVVADGGGGHPLGRSGPHGAAALMCRGSSSRKAGSVGAAAARKQVRQQQCADERGQEVHAFASISTPVELHGVSRRVGQCCV